MKGLQQESSTIMADDFFYLKIIRLNSPEFARFLKVKVARILKVKVARIRMKREKTKAYETWRKLGQNDTENFLNYFLKRGVHLS